MIRISRMFVALFLAALFALALPPAPVAAQEPETAEGGESGRPLDGYIGTSVLAFLALFVVGKSARR